MIVLIYSIYLNNKSISLTHMMKGLRFITIVRDLGGMNWTRKKHVRRRLSEN
jgi:hypothetical protein